MTQAMIQARLGQAALTIDQATKKTGAATAERISKDRASQRKTIQEREAKIAELSEHIREERDQSTFQDICDFFNPFDTTATDYMNEQTGVKADIVKAEKMLRVLKEEQKDVFADLQASADDVRSTTSALDEMLEDQADTLSIGR